MKEITPEGVRQFLLQRYLERIESLGLTPAELPDSFDLLLNGVIDSFGILEMISAVENEFHIVLDFAALDAEEITLLGPLSRYVAESACFRSKNLPNSEAASE
jgi:Acyl carrier protein